MLSELEIPRTLPVDYLSASSIQTFLFCPEKWRRKYIAREYEPPSGNMVLGSAVHAAEAHADSVQIETGERPGSELVQDLFSDEWEDRTSREEVDYGFAKPGELKDSGVRVIRVYDEQIAPKLEPVSVEREIHLDLAHVDWGFRGYLDLEEADGALVDRKVRGTKMSKQAAGTQLAVAPYMLARRAEGNPASVFRFHTFVRTKTPYAEIVPTTRTDAQLDAFVDRLYRVGAEIAWRVEHDVWGYAPPDAWWCTGCGYSATCPGGSLR